MVVSPSVRNKIAGFFIVASSVLIFLPVVLDKDIVRSENPEAIAINSQGAMYDTQGHLQRQAEPNLGHSLNINEPHASHDSTLQLKATQATQAAINDNNSGEMVNFAVNQQGQGAQQQRPAAQPKEEILSFTHESPARAQQPQRTQQRPQAKEEILTVNKPQAQKPSSSASSSSKDPNVVIGTKPNSRFAIQVGVFSKKSNADNVAAKIRKAGYNVYAVRVHSNNRELYRVYAGAANERNALNDTLQKIDKLCGTKGKIVSI